MKFANVTLYLMGEMFGPKRYDCREVEITTGVKYAQYDDAIKVVWTEKGKRKGRATMLTYNPFALVVAQDKAIDPDAPLIPTESSLPGVQCSQSRYGSCDPRWRTDFMAKVEAARVPILLLIDGERKVKIGADVAEDFGPVVNPDGSPGATTIAFAREMGTTHKLRELFPGWKGE